MGVFSLARRPVNHMQCDSESGQAARMRPSRQGVTVSNEYRIRDIRYRQQRRGEKIMLGRTAFARRDKAQEDLETIEGRRGLRTCSQPVCINFSTPRMEGGANTPPQNAARRLAADYERARNVGA